VRKVPSAKCAQKPLLKHLKHKQVSAKYTDMSEWQQIRESQYPSLAEYINKIPSNPDFYHGYCSTKLGNLMFQQVHKVKRIDSLCLPQFAFKDFCKCYTIVDANYA
jgi:hypothetical protein